MADVQYEPEKYPKTLSIGIIDSGIDLFLSDYKTVKSGKSGI